MYRQSTFILAANGYMLPFTIINKGFIMDILKDYTLWLSNQNGGYGLGSTLTLAQGFLNEKNGIYRRRAGAISIDAKLLHDRYMHSE